MLKTALIIVALSSICIAAPMASKRATSPDPTRSKPAALVKQATREEIVQRIVSKVDEKKQDAFTTQTQPPFPACGPILGETPYATFQEYDVDYTRPGAVGSLLRGDFV